MDASVIIPTYNRPEAVLRLLQSLSNQTLPPSSFEVIVVDDGSTRNTDCLKNPELPFQYHYVRQINQGATIARNTGVAHSRGQILVFIDDDVTVTTNTLTHLTEACLSNAPCLMLGTLINLPASEYSQTNPADLIASAELPSDIETCPFVSCNTELLAVRRTDFQVVGQLEDPTFGQGWPNWDDVDFGYRAHLCELELLQHPQAIGIHWDYSTTSLHLASRRWERAALSAVYLFRKHPELQAHIPMFADKTPIVWREDTPWMLLRKLTRQLSAQPWLLYPLETLVKHLENKPGTGPGLNILMRWVNGAYMYRGYQAGLAHYQTWEQNQLVTHRDAT